MLKFKMLAATLLVVSCLGMTAANARNLKPRSRLSRTTIRPRRTRKWS